MSDIITQGNRSRCEMKKRKREEKQTRTTWKNKSAIVEKKKKKKEKRVFPWLKIFWVPYTTMAVRRTAVSRSSKSTGTPLVTTLRNEEDRSRWRWSARAHNTPLPSLSLSFSLFLFRPLSPIFPYSLYYFSFFSLIFITVPIPSLLSITHTFYLSPFSVFLLSPIYRLPLSFS